MRMCPPIVSRRFFRPCLFAAWVLWLVCVPAWAEQVNQVTLLHFNDIYALSPRKEMGGFAPLMTRIEQERQRHPHSLLTFGGDLLSPSVISYLTQGREHLALSNALGVELAVLGNHEFDFGVAVLEKRLAESRYKWLATNVRGGDGRPFPGTVETDMREIGGVRFGFIGLLTPTTGELANLGSQVAFLDPVAVAREWIPRLKEQGAEVVVALTHQTLAEDEKLAVGVENLDIILGGHDHDVVVRDMGKTLILKAGSEGHHLAVLALTILRPEAGEKGKRRLVSEVQLLPTFRLPPHPAVHALVEAAETRLQAELEAAAGETTTELDSRESTVRERESSMGNLFADAIRAETQADLALLNGGGLRGNRLYPAGTLLTRGDIFRESPFGNTVVLLELSEQAIWQALEHAVSQVGQGTGRFLQVSGLSFLYDPRQPVGNRVQEVMRITSTGERVPLDRNGTTLHRVGSTNYLARGGDGYRMLANARTLISAEAGRPLSTVVMQFLGQRKRVANAPEGRIRAVGQ